MSEPFVADAVGVILKHGRNGKFSASRIYIRSGTVVLEDEIATDRALPYAQRAAEDNIRLVTTDYQRDKFTLNRPEQLELFSKER